MSKGTLRLLVWLTVGFLATAAHAQDRVDRRHPLQIASSPHAFAGRTVAVLCEVTRRSLSIYVCPATDQIGRFLADIVIPLEEMSEADRHYILSSCSSYSAVLPCRLEIVGTVKVSEKGGLSLSKPRLKSF